MQRTPSGTRDPRSLLARVNARPVFLATTFVVLVCVSILGIEGWRLTSARRSQITESEVAATNLAKSLAEHASGVFTQADALLAGLVERVETEGLGKASVERIQRLLRSEMSQLTQLDRLSVIDAQGNRVTSSVTTASASGIDHRAREYFRYHASHADMAPHLGPPIQAHINDRWIVTVSRRFNDARGHFAGVIVAAVDLSYFNNYFEQFELGKNGSIVLVMSNGTVIDRRPWKDDLIGTSLAGAPLFTDHIAYDEAGTAWITSRIDGVDRLSAFQKLRIFPAYAVVSFSKEQVLRSWTEDAMIHAGVAAFLVLIIAVIGRQLVLQIARRHEDQVALLDAQGALKALNKQLDGLAREDALTGLPNRRELDRVIDEEIRRVERNHEPLAVIMVDIDQFKAYNDRYGHPQGDACIKAVAKAIASCVTRPGDMAARYGGEEFIILLPETNMAGATAVAERVRLVLRASALAHPNSLTGVVTVSMGMSMLKAYDLETTAEQLVDRADQALYAAKQAGRNAIRWHDDEATDSVPVRARFASAI